MYRVPSDLAGGSGHKAFLHRRVRDWNGQADLRSARRAVCDANDDVLRLYSGGRGSHPRLGVVRLMPHGDHSGSGCGGAGCGRVFEQGTYLEWLRSGQAKDGQNCQSCHVATLKDSRGDLVGQLIAHTPGGGRFGPIRPRAPFGLHFFQGANLQLLGMLRELFPEETAALELTAQRTRESLSSSADVEVTPRFAGATLEVAVTITNRTGHKLPTGFPSRRMWLHVALLDRNGDRVFESGRPDASGEIGPEQPHRTVIVKGEEAAVYESEMQDPSGMATRSLLRASAYAKDNRILTRATIQPFRCRKELTRRDSIRWAWPATRTFCRVPIRCSIVSTQGLRGVRSASAWSCRIRASNHRTCATLKRRDRVKRRCFLACIPVIRRRR